MRCMSKRVSSAVFGTSRTWVRIGLLVVLLFAGGDPVAAQPPALYLSEPMDRDPATIGADAFNFGREDDEQDVLEWEFDWLFGYEITPALYPEAARPDALVQEFGRDEVDWQIAKARFRDRQYEECAARLREMLPRLRVQDTQPLGAVARTFRLLVMALLAAERLDEAAGVHREALEVLQAVGEEAAWPLIDHRVGLAHVQMLLQLPAERRYAATRMARDFQQLLLDPEGADFSSFQKLRSRLRDTCGPRSEAYREFLSQYLMYVPMMVAFQPPPSVMQEFQLVANELTAAARSLYGEGHPQYWRALLITARWQLTVAERPNPAEDVLRSLVQAAGGWRPGDDVGPYELSAERVFALLDLLLRYYDQNGDRRGVDRVRLLIVRFSRTHFGLESWQYRNAWLENRHGGTDDFYRPRAARFCLQGDALRLANRPAEAVAKYQQALQLVEKEFLTNPHPMRLQILERMEWVQQKQGDEARSVDDYPAAIRHLAEAQRLRALRLRPGHWSVVDLKREADEVAALAKLRPEERKMADELRLTAMSMGHVLPAEAAHLWKVPASERRRRIAQLAAALTPTLAADSPTLVDARLALADWYDQQGSLDRSQAIYLNLLEALRSRYGLLHPTCAQLLLRLADTHSKLGEMDQAERSQGEAEAICVRLGFLRRPMAREAPVPKLVESKASEERIQQLQRTFRLYFQQGQPAEALRQGVQWVQAVREIYGTGHREFGIVHTNLAAVYTQLGDYGSAKISFQQAQQAFERAGARRTAEYASCLHNMAVLLERLEQDGEAFELLQQEAAVLAERGEVRTANYAHTLGTTASILLRLNRFDEAKATLNEGIALMRQLGGEQDPVHVQTLHTLGFVALSLGAYEDAAALLTRVAEFWRAEQGPWSDAYAEALHDQGALQDALGASGEAQALFRKSLAITRRNLKAASLVQSERQQIEMITALRRRLDSLLSLAVRCNLEPAEVYQEVLSWKGAVLGGRRSVPDLPEAERRELKQQLQQTQYAVEELAIWPPEAEERERWIQELQETFQEQENVRRQVLEKYRTSIDAAPQHEVTVERLIAALPENTALVDVYQYRHVTWGREGTGLRGAESRLAAFVITRAGDVRLVDLGAVAAADAGIKVWLAKIRDRQTAAAEEPGQALRRAIWEPIEARLGGAESLLISPDGPLCLLPFAALPGKKPGRYLIEERPVTIVASPQLLADERPLAERPPSLLVVGDVDYDNPTYEPWMEFVTPEIAPRRLALTDWRRLPGTRDEMYAIRGACEEAFGEEACKLLPGRLASEATLCGALGDHRWIHLGTHGFYADDLRPSYISTLPPGADAAVSLAASWNLADIHPDLLSGLVLAGANQPSVTPNADGLLTAREVANLELPDTELVVLSACETGLGELRRGEGLLGLQRAFHSAGARNVIASLWKVDDAATCLLMARFYENLWVKNMSQPDALRQAQMSMLRSSEPLSRNRREADPAVPNGADRRGAKPQETERPEELPRSPYYWAAFVLSTAGR